MFADIKTNPKYPNQFQPGDCGDTTNSILKEMLFLMCVTTERRGVEMAYNTN